MGKILVLVLIGLVVYAVISGYARRARREERIARQTMDTPPHNENMVRCAHCGIHLPREEATTSKGNYFCSNEHRSLFQK